MKRIYSIAIMTVCAMFLQAQTVVRVARFKGDRAAAVSYTFDDGLLDQYTELFPKLKEYGIKGTFGINGNTICRYERLVAIGDTSDILVREKPRMTWKMIREMSDNGQEMTSHGWSHSNVNRLEGEALRHEVQHNDTVIWEKTGRFPRTFIYPGNAKSPAKVEYCERGRVGSRVSQISIGSKRDDAWLCRWISQLIKNREWGVGMTHGISSGYDHFRDPNVLWRHFAHVNTLRDSVWIGTFHDISAYIKERDAVKLKIKERRGGKITVKPSCPLDKELFNEPLTLIVDKPLISAEQDGISLDISRRDNVSMMDFNPNGGKVSIKTAE